MIDLNAAVNAAYALYRPVKFNNISDSKLPLMHLLFRDSENKEPKTSSWDAITLVPHVYEIYNIK